ncbi:SRPBCC family protein [Streptomyces canus]|uniref:SRPBCC family protein n=1 Tax=Streptomyces canus TaxID=58343 RepID=UPI002E359876|nr:SRPBCC family protein [Streptomyces canus]
MEWTGARYADKPTAEVHTWIAAPSARVWALVADIELMPRLSSELQSVEWLDGRSGPAPGARFIGRSKHEAFGEWATTSHIVEYEPSRTLAWAVEDPQHPSAIWRFTLAPQDGGTLLTEWMQMGPGRSGLSFAIDRMPEKEQKIVFVRMREFEANMTVTLEKIKKLAESPGGTEGTGVSGEAGL